VIPPAKHGIAAAVAPAIPFLNSVRLWPSLSPPLSSLLSAPTRHGRRSPSLRQIEKSASAMEGIDISIRVRSAELRNPRPKSRKSASAMEGDRLGCAPTLGRHHRPRPLRPYFNSVSCPPAAPVSSLVRHQPGGRSPLSPVRCLPMELWRTPARARAAGGGGTRRRVAAAEPVHWPQWGWFQPERCRRWIGCSGLEEWPQISAFPRCYPTQEDRAQWHALPSLLWY
jgi:hypothetical protein